VTFDDRGVGYYTTDFPQEHTAFKKNTLLASKWDLNLRRKMFIWIMALNGAEVLNLRKGK